MILLCESFIVTKILKCWEDTFRFDHRIDSSARKLVRGSNISIGQMHVLSSQNSWTCVGSHGKTERDYLVVTSCDAMRLVVVENCWFYWEAELFLLWHSYNTNENSLKGRCRVKFQLETQKMNVCVLSDVQSIFLSHLAQVKFWESKCLSRFALFSSRQKKLNQTDAEKENPLTVACATIAFESIQNFNVQFCRLGQFSSGPDTSTALVSGVPLFLLLQLFF